MKKEITLRGNDELPKLINETESGKLFQLNETEYVVASKISDHIDIFDRESEEHNRTQAEFAMTLLEKIRITKEEIR